MKKYLILSAALLLLCSNFIFAEDPDQEEESTATILLPHIYTDVELPAVEQRTVITSEEIKTSHAPDLTSLLSQKGIQILAYGAYGLQSQPSIRGFTDETVRVVIDGVCVNNAQYGTFDFTSINPSSIERIEIIKGGFTESVKDEGAVGGVIYITTKKQSLKKEFFSETSLKTFFNKEAPVDAVSEKFSAILPVFDSTCLKFNASGTAAENKYFYKDYTKKIKIQENSSVWDSNLNFGIDHYFGNGSSITLTDAVYAGNKNCPGSETSRSTGLQKDYNNRFSLSVINPELFGLIRLENNAAYLKNIRFYNSDSESSSHYIDTFKYSVEGKYSSSPFINESAGLSLEYVNLNSTDDGKHCQLSAAVSSSTKIKLPGCFTVTVPLAVKLCGSNYAVIPKLGISRETGNLKIYADGYRMVQFPNMDDLYWSSSTAQGNPDLKPEKGWGGDIGFNWQNFLLPFSINVFTNYYSEKIQWTSVNNVYTPQNVASAFYAGVDFNCQRTFLKDSLILKFNCEYLYNCLLDSSNELTYGNRIMMTPDLVASLEASYSFRNVDFNVDASYTGKRYKDNTNNAYLDPYVLVNAAVNFKAGNHFTPFVRIDNLLNWYYYAYDSYPMPGISFTMGLKASW